MNIDFRLGIVAQRILVDFDVWLLDQMEQAVLGPGNQVRMQGVLWGEVGRCFGT